MATKQKDSVAGKEKHTRRLQPSTTPPGISVAKDHGKAPTGELRKHVPNYLRPTVSSKPDVAGKHLDTSHNKPNPTTVRRRSLDRPAPPSHVHKAPQSSSSARGERNAAAAAPLKSSSVTVTRNAASSERVSMVVKAVKAQPPLVKLKTLPKVSNVRKEVKSSGLKKKEEEEPVQAPNAAESEAEESLDLNVEEELAKMESHVDLPHEEHVCADKEHVNEEHESPKQHVDADEEKLISDDITVSEVEVIKDETQDDQESNQLLNEAPDDDDDTKKEADADIEEMKTVGLTVKTTPDESETEQQVAEKQDQELHSSEEKPASAEAESVVVHKRQVGGPISKKESPAYNDVIEETASKLVEKRVNKVRALAGAFETVISLQQPDSS